MNLTRFGVLLLACSLGTAAQAQIITNGGFEAPGFSPSPDAYVYLHPNFSTQDSVAGWTFAGTTGSWEASFWMHSDGYPENVPAGTYPIALGNTDVMSTSFSTVSSQTYQVSFLSRYADPVAADSLTVTAAGTSAQFTPGASFATFSFNFTASSTGTESLAFDFNSANPVAPQKVYLDSVSITAIPEAGVTALGAGALALTVAAVRRRANCRAKS